jgi:hypothetical protein
VYKAIDRLCTYAIAKVQNPHISSLADLKKALFQEEEELICKLSLDDKNKYILLSSKIMYINKGKSCFQMVLFVQFGFFSDI